MVNAIRLSWLDRQYSCKASTECEVTRTASADVTQPEHAKQSATETDTGSLFLDAGSPFPLMTVPKRSSGEISPPLLAEVWYTSDTGCLCPCGKSNRACRLRRLTTRRRGNAADSPIESEGLGRFSPLLGRLLAVSEVALGFLLDVNRGLTQA